MALPDYPFAVRCVCSAARRMPGFFWNMLQKKTSSFAGQKFAVILSFDCDTSEDAIAAEKLYRRICELRLDAYFAVPGEQLKENADIYRRLSHMGAQFINHGFLSHAVRKDNVYQSRTFYHLMNMGEIETDIRMGHETIQEVVGQTPQGFRTPHFGLFQKTAQVRSVHKIIKKLGYKFSTSTTPIYTLLRGPMWNDDGIIEFPLAGAFSSPLTVFDSYSYLSYESDRKVKPTYGKTFASTIQYLLDRNFSGVLNYYADPSHIIESEEYDLALSSLTKYNVRISHYEDLLIAPP